MLSAVIMGLVGLVVVIGIAILISHFNARA
ncbi:MAG: hypothetical protein C207_00015 [Bradyrhizobium sp. DFCI-1]|jgi:hypothetical protein|nr:MAG: hypothetical protein C207_00015 [Bradyrhizobium sp. DFCI-1]WIG49399.1 MAG: hypothetical protein OJF48_000314 [Afipia sp.]